MLTIEQIMLTTHSQNNATLMIGAPQGSSSYPSLDIVIKPTINVAGNAAARQPPDGALS